MRPVNLHPCHEGQVKGGPEVLKTDSSENSMKRRIDRYAGPMVDVLFAAAFTLLTYLVPALQQAADRYPVLHLRIGITGLFLYSAACAIILSRFSSSSLMQEGLRGLSRNMWRWFSWPLGIFFWVSLLFHGVAMTMSAGWGEMIYGVEINRFATAGDTLAMILGLVFFLAVSLYLASRMSGYGYRRIKKMLKDNITELKEQTMGFMIFMIVIQLIFIPIIALIGVAFLVALPFYLYCIIWGFAMYKANRKEKFRNVIPDSPSANAGTMAVFLAYSFVMAFFYDSIINHMAAISRSDPTYGPVWLMAFFALAVYYFPFRIFFAVGSGKNPLGWITFALNIAVVYHETWKRFTG